MEIKYHDKVFQVLQKIELGKPLVVAKTVRPENMEAFREAVCMAIDLNWGAPLYRFEPNGDWTEIRKMRR